MSTPNESHEKTKHYLSPLFYIGGILFFVAGAIFALFILFVLSVGINSNGSPQLAAEWRDEMSAWEAPEDSANSSNVSVYEFSNGEWVVVKSKNSHGGFWYGGGTVVVKDSEDRLNTYHEGHVCGDGNPFIFDESGKEPEDLKSFYDALEISDFQEFVIE